MGQSHYHNDCVNRRVNRMSYILFWQTLGILTLISLVSCISEECTRSLTEEAKDIIAKAESELKIALDCETSTDGGNWIVIQHHLQQNSDLFTEGDWANYSAGFVRAKTDEQKGVLRLGLTRLAQLTQDGKWQLLIKARWSENLGNVSASSEGWGIWANFSIGGAEKEFPLLVGAMTNYDNVPRQMRDTTPEEHKSQDKLVFNPLAIHNGMRFSTPDRDNDKANTFSCAASFRSGWWFNQCYHLNLNHDPPAWFDGTNVHFPMETFMAIRPSR